MKIQDFSFSEQVYEVTLYLDEKKSRILLRKQGMESNTICWSSDVISRCLLLSDHLSVLLYIQFLRQLYFFI